MRYQTIEEIPSFTLSWSHYLKLMRISNPEERRFYEIEATNNKWSLKELERQYNSSLYERLALSRNKEDILKHIAEGKGIQTIADEYGIDIPEDLDRRFVIEELLEVAKTFVDCGFKLVATKGTCTFLRENGIPVGRAMKIQEDVPNLTHDILEGRIDLVIDTPSLKNETARADAYVRQTAIKARVPYMTTMAAAKATAEGIKAVKEQGLIGVMSLQEIHKAID